MIYRRFGKTELQIPVISFGCMRSMHNWDDTPLSEIPSGSNLTLEDLVTTALSHGINHMETAHAYGSSERQMGVVLQNIDRSKIILQTKVTPHHDPQVFVGKFHESLARLQQDSIELLAIHGINDYQSLWHSCRKGGCLEAARKLQKEGKVQHIGFSGHGPVDVILEAINHEENGGFDFVNLHWYYIYDINRSAIERAAERDLGVYIISPTDKGGMLYNPPPIIEDLCAPLSPILFNDTYCLNQPGVTSISVGAAKLSDFDEHLKVMDTLTAPEFDTKISAIVTKLENQMERATGFRRPEGNWQELPPWGQCPGTINLQLINWFANLVKGWHLHEYAKNRYNMLSLGSEWVQGNNSAAIDLVDFSEIQKKYPAITGELLSELHDLHRLLAKTSEQR